MAMISARNGSFKFWLNATIYGSISVLRFLTFLALFTIFSLLNVLSKALPGVYRNS